MNFRKLLLETAEDVNSGATVEDITFILEKLNLDKTELEDIAEGILDNYVLFSDEIDFIDNDYEDDVSYDEEGTVEYVEYSDKMDDEDDEDDEYGKEYDEDEYDEMDEAFKKVSKGIRIANNREAKRKRKRPTIKRGLKKRAQKSAKCSANQHVTKVGPNVFKCVAKNSKDRKKSRRLKKFKRIYKNG